MTEREAVEAITSLPSIRRIWVADLKPDDVIVFECDAHLTVPEIDRIKATAEGIWPGRKIVVIDRNIKMKVVPRAEVC